MKQRLFYLAIAFAFSCLGTAQTFNWGKSFGGISEDTVRNMVVDSQGNCYITGYFAKTAIFQEGQNPISLSTDIFGFSDIYVAKINAEGVVLWAKSFGGPDHDYGNGIALDAQGNILITGIFTQTAMFNPGGEGGELTSNGFQDLFVLKLNQDGNFIWVKGFGSPNYEESVSVATDATGNVYLTGYFFSSIDFDPSENEYIMNVTSDSSNGFIMKMNAAGEFVWAKQIGASGASYSGSVKVAQNGEIYVLGAFTGATDLNPAANGEFLVESAGKDIYLLRLDATGNFLNAYTSAVLNESSTTEAPRFTTDALGNIFIIGNFMGTVNFDPMQNGSGFTLSTDGFLYNSFVLKISPEGTPAWVKKITGNGMTLTYDIAVSAQNNILISGYFTGSAEFGTINIAQQSPNYMDSFFAKMNANGEFQSANSFAGTGGADGHEIELGPENSIYLSSAYHETVDLNPLEGELTMAAAGNEGYADIYLIKLTDEVLGLPENHTASNTVIYPNPAGNFIQIAGKENFAGQGYQLYDISGRQVLKGTFDHQQKIILNDLSKGSYILVVGDRHRFKLIKN